MSLDRREKRGYRELAVRTTLPSFAATMAGSRVTSVDVLLALGDGSRRYHELLHDLTPISEKVLTQTLRAMERDGLIGRRVHAEVPPRVDYALTPLGATLAAPMRALGSWAVAHGRHVEAARERFDLRRAIQRQEQRKAA